MNTANAVLSVLFFGRRSLDVRTSGRLLAVKLRARGLARHGVRQTVRIACVSMAQLVEASS